mmetsp:Transcript_9206/g.19957  ORF Transcript_9206/g.19957 Transcript_9206/m.19957 type:complete len:146 (+) Transcript_9206:526-963(+)
MRKRFGRLGERRTRQGLSSNMDNSVVEGRMCQAGPDGVSHRGADCRAYCPSSYRRPNGRTDRRGSNRSPNGRADRTAEPKPHEVSFVFSGAPGGRAPLNCLAAPGVMFDVSLREEPPSHGVLVESVQLERFRLDVTLDLYATDGS